MTRAEIDRARRELKKREILQEELHGVPATLHYRANIDRLVELLGSEALGEEVEPLPRDEHGKFVSPEEDPVCRNSANCPSLPEHGKLDYRDAANQSAVTRQASLPQHGTLSRDYQRLSEITPLRDDAREDFDSLFPRDEQDTPDIWLPAPFEVPEGMTVQEYVVQRGDEIISRRAARFAGKDSPWGSQSPTFEKYLSRPDVDADKHRELGRFLDEELALLPVWDDKRDVANWCAGLTKLGKAVEWQTDVIRAAYKQMERDELVVSSPFSLVKVARSLVHERRAKRRKQTEVGAVSPQEADALVDQFLAG